MAGPAAVVIVRGFVHDVYRVENKATGVLLGHRAVILTHGGGFLEVMVWEDVLNGPEAVALKGQEVEVEAKIGARAGSSGGAFLNVTAHRVSALAG